MLIAQTGRVTLNIRKKLKTIFYTSLIITAIAVSILLIKRQLQKKQPAVEQAEAVITKKSAHPVHKAKTDFQIEKVKALSQTQPPKETRGKKHNNGQQDQERQIDRVMAYIEEVSFLYSDAISEEKVSTKKLEKILRRISQIRKIAQSRNIEDLVDTQSLSQIEENVTTYLNALATSR